MGTGAGKGLNFGNSFGARKEKKTESLNSNSEHISSLEDNAISMASDYPYDSKGYFGEKGKNCRVISSDNPEKTSKDFYQKIGRGGTLSDLPNGKGTKTLLSDGTLIVHRLITSTKDSPAIEITVSGSTKIKNQKIHFILEEE